jgi:hypothetical protein
MIRTLILAAAGGGVAVAPTTWNLTVQTTGASQDYSVDINAGTTPNIVIDWGDTGVDTYTTTGIKTHTYSAAGTYTVKISGSFASGGNIRLNVVATRTRLKATGVICTIPGLLNFQQTFQACTGLTSIPVDLFRYNTLLSARTGFMRHSGCTGLTSLPTDLFRYNTAVSTRVSGLSMHSPNGYLQIVADSLRSLLISFDTILRSVRTGFIGHSTAVLDSLQSQRISSDTIPLSLGFTSLAVLDSLQSQRISSDTIAVSTYDILRLFWTHITPH